MRQFLISFILAICTISTAFGADMMPPTDIPVGADYVPISEIQTRTPDDTQCATGVFANALSETVNTVSETDDEITIRKWIYDAFSTPETIEKVLACPEIASAADDDTITFLPIEYTFPGGRQIVVNYETQPKILKQRLTIAQKRELPSDTNPSPQIGAPDDASVWTNTDPAWYAIMVVEHGALDEFVGPDKNNTISLQWINDNIDDIYPHGNSCTSKTALAGDNDMVNLAGKATVNLTDDTNDYYVAGDANLQWISYLEIGLDVVITVATFGGGAVVLGATKAARASRALKNLTTAMRALRQEQAVINYIKIVNQHTRALRELQAIDRATDAARYASKLDEVENLARQMRNMERNSDLVRDYRQASDTFSSLNQYRRALRSLRPAQRGNIMARAWRAFRAANTGGKKINRAARIARSSMKSGRIRDWLFQSTLSNVGALAKMEEAGGFIYGALNFVGGMYDWTETSTGEFTNDIEFKPLTLLSADDLQGQENVVNHGMWFMWLGDSVNPADDDAAYLQAMDFADKFHYNLEEIQTDKNNHACNVDIYVVRPIIRNPGTENAEMYYLIMNDEPWTTNNPDE